MGFLRQEYWSGLPCPSLGDLPDPGIKPESPDWQTISLPVSHLGNLAELRRGEQIGSTAVVLKAWYSDSSISNLWICQKCMLLGTNPAELSQQLWRWGSGPVFLKPSTMFRWDSNECGRAESVGYNGCILMRVTGPEKLQLEKKDQVGNAVRKHPLQREEGK